MPRLLLRGSSTSKFVEDGWSHEEAPAILQSSGDHDGGIHDKASLLMLVSGVFNRGLSFFKSQNKAGEDGMPGDLQSFLNGSNSDKGLLTQLPELSTLPCHPSHSNGSFISLPTQVQNRRILSSPLAKITLLSFISIFVLVAVLGSTSAGYSSSSASRLIYNSYRRLQEDFSSLDLISGGIFGLGSLHPKELMTCSKDLEHHVPCYNVTSAYKSGLGNGEEYDRHCELSEGRTPCLTRPPKNYSLPPRWPHSKHSVWIGNIKLTDNLKGSKMERITWRNSNQLQFEPQAADQWVDGHFNKISDLLGISDDTLLSKAGVQTVLDIGCSYGSFAAHLLSRNVMTICIASYEYRNSHVQLALDRGLPAMIGSLVTRQLPYPSSSFSMIHCADCGIDWGQKDGLLLLEVDRLLKAEGYFVWMLTNMENSTEVVAREQILKSIDENAKSMCWTSLSPRGGVVTWRKSDHGLCSAHSNRTFSVCGEDKNGDIGVYQGLRHCLDVTKQGPVLSPQQLASSVSGFSWEELSDDPTAWLSTIKNYWSIITPLLFSDHPKRPAEDDPLPPSNILRNIMDMNALYGSFNAALLETGKLVWVMNVVPTSGPNTLPFIYQRGLIGTWHDWCEAFPTYPRTYDLLHGIGILSQQAKARTRCSLSSLLLEMDRILRPEGWVLLRDSFELIEEARFAASQMRWEARIIEVEGDSDVRLLVCQKVFWKR